MSPDLSIFVAILAKRGAVFDADFSASTTPFTLVHFAFAFAIQGNALAAMRAFPVVSYKHGTPDYVHGVGAFPFNHKAKLVSLISECITHSSENQNWRLGYAADFDPNWIE